MARVMLDGQELNALSPDYLARVFVGGIDMTEHCFNVDRRANPATLGFYRLNQSGSRYPDGEGVAYIRSASF